MPLGTSGPLSRISEHPEASPSVSSLVPRTFVVDESQVSIAEHPGSGYQARLRGQCFFLHTLGIWLSKAS